MDLDAMWRNGNFIIWKDELYHSVFLAMEN